MTNLWLRTAVILLAGGAGLLSAAESNVELQNQVRDTERAFARTMASRDHTAFTSFLSEETVFLASKTPLRGRKAVAEAWKHYFEGPRAPFSWEPDRVEVLDSGTLAISTGPVRDPDGQRIGTFTSTWRRETGGQWRIILDSGCPACECPQPARN
jgi:ketosteroid isomerase-like protein